MHIKKKKLTHTLSRVRIDQHRIDRTIAHSKTIQHHFFFDDRVVVSVYLLFTVIVSLYNIRTILWVDFAWYFTPHRFKPFHLFFFFVVFVFFFLTRTNKSTAWHMIMLIKGFFYTLCNSFNKILLLLSVNQMRQSMDIYIYMYIVWCMLDFFLSLLWVRPL